MLFATDEKTFLEKIEKLKFSKKIHIDFMDGIFVKKKSCDFKFIENVFKKKSLNLKFILWRITQKNILIF